MDDIKVPLEFKTKYLVEHNIELATDTPLELLPVEIDQEICIAYLQKLVVTLRHRNTEETKEGNIKVNFKVKEVLKDALLKLNMDMREQFEIIIQDHQNVSEENAILQ
jgi:hypothetical protein